MSYVYVDIIPFLHLGTAGYLDRCQMGSASAKQAFSSLQKGIVAVIFSMDREAVEVVDLVV